MSDVLDPARYTVAWIAPLEIEARAALYLLDYRHRGRFPLARGDDYIFYAGDMCGHHIVIATLPAGQEYGTGLAAALASQVKKFFPNLWFGTSCRDHITVILVIKVTPTLQHLQGSQLCDFCCPALHYLNRRRIYATHWLFSGLKPSANVTAIEWSNYLPSFIHY